MSFHRPPLLDPVKVYWDTYRMFGEAVIIHWHQTIPGLPPYQGPPPPMDSPITPAYDVDEVMYDPEAPSIDQNVLSFLDQVYKDTCKK